MIEKSEEDDPSRNTHPYNIFVSMYLYLYNETLLYYFVLPTKIV